MLITSAFDLASDKKNGSPMSAVKRKGSNREDKSLRHVAMVAKFLDDKKTEKRHVKLFQTPSSISFSFN